VVASGTATVEAALAGTPFVVVYRLTPLTWLLGRWLVKLDTFAMPNLIAGRKIVTELIQHNFTVDNVLRELRAVIPEGEARRQMIAGPQAGTGGSQGPRGRRRTCCACITRDFGRSRAGCKDFLNIGTNASFLTQ